MFGALRFFDGEEYYKVTQQKLAANPNMQPTNPLLHPELSVRAAFERSWYKFRMNLHLVAKPVHTDSERAYMYELLRAEYNVFKTRSIHVRVDFAEKDPNTFLKRLSTKDYRRIAYNFSTAVWEAYLKGEQRIKLIQKSVNVEEMYLKGHRHVYNFVQQFLGVLKRVKKNPASTNVQVILNEVGSLSSQPFECEAFALFYDELPTFEDIAPVSIPLSTSFNRNTEPVAVERIGAPRSRPVLAVLAGEVEDTPPVTQKKKRKRKCEYCGNCDYHRKESCALHQYYTNNKDYFDSQRTSNETGLQIATKMFNGVILPKWKDHSCWVDPFAFVCYIIHSNIEREWWQNAPNQEGLPNAIGNLMNAIDVKDRVEKATKLISSGILCVHT